MFNSGFSRRKSLRSYFLYSGLALGLTMMMLPILTTVVHAEEKKELFRNGKLYFPGGTVTDSSGRGIGNVESNGTVTDSSGRGVGNIESNGTVTDSSGRGVGNIESNGTVTDSSGRGIGDIESDGTVTDSSGRGIGNVGSDGTVTDNRGRTIGNVPPGNVAAGALLLLKDKLKN